MGQLPGVNVDEGFDAEVDVSLNSLGSELSPYALSGRTGFELEFSYWPQWTFIQGPKE